MSLALTDFLIEVSEPARLLLFQKDPGAFMSRFDLTEEDKDAIRSRDIWQIRYLARSTDVGADPNQVSQFNGSMNPAEIEIEPQVEIAPPDTVVLPNVPNTVAVGSPGTLFADDNGQLYRAVAAE
jgi:hypothetical protein